MFKKLISPALITLLIISLLPLTAQAMVSNTLQSGTLIKGPTNSVYYLGADGKRYVFPNEKTYKTWFSDFLLVIPISTELLGEIPIGGNATYKPGARLVKITTDPKVYWVDKLGTLRHISGESIAKQLWGNYWPYLIDDVPDAFFVNYKMGSPITTPVLPTIESDYTINEDKTLSTQPDPTYSELSKINLTGYIEKNAAKLTWSVENLTAESGFKIVMANKPDPIYPGNDFHYKSNPSDRSDVWYDLATGTYYFRVCQYLDGKCGIYSNNLTLTVGSGSQPSTSSKSISLKSSVAANGTVTLNWTANFTSSQGFKTVKSTQINPVYPGNDYHYLSEPNTISDTWTGLSGGTYHFRVCEYLGGSCGTYSNDISVIVPGTTTDNSDGTITLSGNVNSGIVYLNWVVKNMSSAKGFKIVKSTEPNPVYPGNAYHYLSDPDVRTDTWTELGPATYHFRVCEYLGGSCGVYSNDLSLTVQ
jgi:hypothetical protein